MNRTLEKMLNELRASKFWGQVQIDYQNGEAVLIRKTQTYKLKENNHEPRGENR